MENKFFKVSALAAAMVGAIAATPVLASEANAVGDGYVEAVDNFIHDATFTGAAVVDTRYRGRANADGDIETRLNYSSYNLMMNFNSGYHKDTVGIDLGGYFSGDIYNDSIEDADGNKLCNEISICQSGDWTDGSSNFKVTTAAIKLKLGEKTDAQVGFIQGGVGTIGNVWSFVPGTYRGFKVSTTLDNGMTLGYMGTDDHSAPWLINSEDATEPWYNQQFSYLHSVGLNGSVGDLTYGVGIGQALDVNYGTDDQDNFSYKIDTSYAVNDSIKVGYNMYGVDDDEMYNGFAAHHGLSLNWSLTDKVSWLSQVQYTQLDADAGMGEFAPRTMARYGSNQGGFYWWDALSDWNMPGEVAWYNRLSYDTGTGWGFNLGFGYGTGADESVAGFSYESEYAINGDITYSVSSGALKGTLFKLHATQLERDPFDGKEDRDEQDLRFIVIAPFSFF
ncbi:outer membrane porin, OprD family [Vibrio sp. SG41-7]|uniref:OprD family outer membrane porin n=1 Tax=Vibrio sp. SG41-7 TaxID=2760973 RepID=UPI001600CAF9|nr:OprD family outer membrane porin [Vibrio sp. SG41-7]MBB1463296.1 outer membrane porin, OprD family [Vibrio sp. SG41-7]